MVRILRVVWNMELGGIETTAMHLLRGMDPDRFQTDFLYVEPTEGAYDDEIRSLGSTIFICPKKNLLRFGRHFRSILRDHGPYDVVHSHLELFTGVVLMLAHASGVPARVAHAHSDHSERFVHRRRHEIWLNRLLIRRHATARLAISRRAADSYYGARYANAHAQLLLQGRDFDPYAAPIDRAAVRQDLAIPADAFVIGHVGRMSEVKNHRFMLRVAAEVARRVPDMRALFVGDGPLREEIEREAARLGLTDRTIFAGTRLDVPRLLCGAVDSFLFPSHYEGLGMAAVEAQAAGLPCVISNHLPRELDLVGPLVRRVALTEPVTAWAEAILATRSPSVTRAAALEMVRSSQYSAEFQIRMLERVYARLPMA
jgi:glycosyltransferase involved in cell wall biosynthesis